MKYCSYYYYYYYCYYYYYPSYHFCAGYLQLYPETKHVSGVYNVADVLDLHYVLRVMLFYS
jgi:hypothetical protein